MKILLKLSLLLFIFSCSTSSQIAQLPDWYLNPPKNNSAKLYGVGYGSKEQATKLALNNVSENILVLVYSKYKQDAQESRVNDLSEYEAATERSIKSESLAIEFSNHEVEKAEQIQDQVYVLVSVSRDELLDNYKAKIEKDHEKILALQESQKKQSSIKKLISYHEIKKIISDQELRFKIIETISKSQKYTKPYQNSYQKILEEEIVLRENTLIRIVSKASDKRISDALGNALNKLKFNITYKEIASNTGDNIILRITTKTEHQRLYGSHLAKINITLKLIENFGKQIASNNIEIKGASKMNSSAAIDSALKDLNKKIEEQGIFNILGI